MERHCATRASHRDGSTARRVADTRLCAARALCARAACLCVAHTKPASVIPLIARAARTVSWALCLQRRRIPFFGDTEFAGSFFYRIFALCSARCAEFDRQSLNNSQDVWQGQGCVVAGDIPARLGGEPCAACARLRRRVRPNRPTSNWGAGGGGRRLAAHPPRGARSLGHGHHLCLTRCTSVVLLPASSPPPSPLPLLQVVVARRRRRAASPSRARPRRVCSSPSAVSRATCAT